MLRFLRIEAFAHAGSIMSSIHIQTPQIIARPVIEAVKQQ
jgi:hypothetical protein